MTKRYLVQLAGTYVDQNVGGWLMSEKLDGMRAYWDGGVTKGMRCADVPWANTAKDHIRIEDPISTGLWSRGGKTIPAPDEWLVHLPEVPLDGELYLGPGRFQDVMSTCKAAGRDWDEVSYEIYGMPSMITQFSRGEMCFNAQQKIELNCGDFWDDLLKQKGHRSEDFMGKRLGYIDLCDNDVIHVVEQTRLPLKRSDFGDVIAAKLEEVEAKGGEGLVLANGAADWEPVRSKNLLKVKSFQEGEAEVVGYIWGRETDRGSKLANLMGQLTVRFNGKIFGLSGFNDEERILCNVGVRSQTEMSQWIPGEPVEEEIHSLQFPLGSPVRFKYRELTDDGLPKEARYWR